VPHLAVPKRRKGVGADHSLSNLNPSGRWGRQGRLGTELGRTTLHRLRLLDLAKFQLDRGDTTEHRHDDFDPGARLVTLEYRETEHCQPSDLTTFGRLRPSAAMPISSRGVHRVVTIWRDMPMSG
jgi:hypothetical protein